MITMLNLGANGRLGNQLFQYAALRSAALSNNLESKIPNQNKMHWHGQDSLLDNFNIQSKQTTQEDISNIRHHIDEPSNARPGTYLRILENLPDNCSINGFFQNEKYFIKNKNSIIKELQVKNSSQSLDLIHRYSNKYKLVSLHIRLGDVTDGTNPVYETYHGSGPLDKNCIVGQYNLKAIDMLQNKDTLFLVFGGGSRSGDDSNDLRFLTKYFKEQRSLFCNEPIVVQTNDPIKDFVAIQNCYSNITSFASTFSWWASYLNLNADTVIAPINFYYDQNIIPEEGFFPLKWKLI